MLLLVKTNHQKLEDYKELISDFQRSKELSPFLSPHREVTWQLMNKLKKGIL